MKVENIEVLINKEVRIIEYQSTFLIIEFDNDLYRINFKDKVEFYLSKNKKGIFKIETQNPLLINYQEPFVTTFINSAYEKSEKFINELKDIVNFETQNKRNWKMYFEVMGINLTLDVIQNNIKNGRGKLCEAPISITKKIVEYCNSLKIKTKTFDDLDFQIKPYKMLNVENNYVIALDFELIQIPDNYSKKTAN